MGLISTCSEIRVDAYPFTQYGSIKGKLSKIGAEALPSENRNETPKFPAYITPEDKFNLHNIEYNLKSGQSISANIIIKKKRLITVISDIFSKLLIV